VKEGEDLLDTQMDSMSQRLAKLIEEGQRALGKEVVVLSEAQEDEIDDGSDLWIEEEPAATTASSSSRPSTPTMASRPRSPTKVARLGHGHAHSLRRQALMPKQALSLSSTADSEVTVLLEV